MNQHKPKIALCFSGQLRCHFKLVEHWVQNVIIPLRESYDVILFFYVIVNPGVTLAQGSVIGANSFVTKNTEPWTIYIGNPAKPVKLRKKETMIEYAKKLGYQFEIK